MHLGFLLHSEENQIYKFSKLSHNNFHPQKRSFVNNFFWWKAIIKIEYVFYSPWDLGITNFQKNLSSNMKISNNLMEYLILISTTVYVYIYVPI